MNESERDLRRENPETADIRWIHGDARKVASELPKGSINAIVTGVPGFGSGGAADAADIGNEETVPSYVTRIREVFDALRPILKPDGTAWLHVRDSLYSGRGRGGTERSRLRPLDRPGGAGIGARQKSLLGIPWRIAHDLSGAGWSVRAAIQIGRATESQHTADRPRAAGETLFLLARNRHYRYQPARMLNEPAADVWIIQPPVNWRRTQAFADEIPRRCLLLAGIEPGETVLDPFAGTGTTLVAAARAGAKGIGIEIRNDLEDTVETRLQDAHQLRLGTEAYEGHAAAC